MHATEAAAFRKNLFNLEILIMASNLRYLDISNSDVSVNLFQLNRGLLEVDLADAYDQKVHKDIYGAQVFLMFFSFRNNLFSESRGGLF